LISEEDRYGEKKKGIPVSSSFQAEDLLGSRRRKGKIETEPSDADFKLLKKIKSKNS
jgi:hypothetical protein